MGVPQFSFYQQQNFFLAMQVVELTELRSTCRKRAQSASPLLLAFCPMVLRPEPFSPAHRSSMIYSELLFLGGHLLMQQLGVTEESAYSELRRQAMNQGLRMSDLARRLIGEMR